MLLCKVLIVIDVAYFFYVLKNALWKRRETLCHIADSYERVICIRTCMDDPFPRCERARLSIKLYFVRQALPCADYDIIQVETRRLESAWAVTIYGQKLYEYIFETMRRNKGGREKARWRISEFALTVINPLNKVIEDSRGSVRVNLRRL